MTTRIGTDVQFGPDDIHHKYLAASDGHAGFGTVKIGTPGVGGSATLYFQDTALIDAMVTHLAELKTEMLAAQQPEPERVVFTDEDDGEPEGCTCAFAPGVCDAHVKPKAAGMQSPAPVVRIIDQRDGCECGHPAADHHDNQVTGGLTYCNACGIGTCGAFRLAVTAPQAAGQ